MSVKIMLEVKDGMYDLWEFRSIKKSERYNEAKEDIEYLLEINKDALATNYNDLEVVFDSKEERDSKYRAIKNIFDESENVVVI